MYIVIFVTAANKEEAKLIAASLLKKKLVACVNIVDKVESFFWWKGKIDSAKEALLIIKSKRANFPKITKLIKSIHSYDVPEIIAIEIISGYIPYLNWIDDSVK